MSRPAPFLFAVGFIVFMSSAPARGQNSVFATPESAAEDPDFSIQGEYVGPKQAMQVIAMGDGDFDVVIYAGGLPGAGWDKSPPRRIALDEDQILDVADANEMRRVERKSPTLGKQPPAGAVVLFDGTPETMKAHWEKGRITDDGLLMEGVTSKDKFQDYTLHVEFRTPYMPKARGQGRGNSGVYQQGRYETQVLDSFGLAGKMNETGGIYSIRDPDLNMCLPPLSWQTYDIDFASAKFDDSGKKTADAIITVRLNGVIVQQDVALTHKTTAAPVDEGPDSGPIYIQNHGNPIRYRNIWVMPRDMARESRRPRIPGFERFYAQGDADPAIGGKLLLGELGCVSCHADSGGLAASRQAPILDTVGSRVRPDHLLAFIQDPHGVKPGTTMPDLVGQMSDEKRSIAAKAIASFLVSTGQVVDRVGDPVAARRGRETFHMIGCTACHAPQDGTNVSDATTVPLANLGEKYTFDSLSQFLKQPHKVRPSGRMPSFGLNDKDSADLATYLLRDVILGAGAINVKAAYYEGSWDKLPDFDQLKPTAELESYGFDLIGGGRRDNFGVRFDTFFTVPKKAKYKFHLSSDDGSRMFIDGHQAIDNDGIHGMQTRSEEVLLEKGVHTLRVEFFEKGGGEELRLEIEGGGLNRSPIESIATLDESGEEPEPLFQSTFQADPDLIDQGRELFAAVGCASCHQMKQENKKLESKIAAKPLNDLQIDSGCLAENVPAELPNYEFTSVQRDALRDAIASAKNNSQLPSDADRIHMTMARMNCYACHSRDKLGGPESSRDAVFKTTMKEMGDEGRVPPPLTGVGDKLKQEYIKDILNKGADERPYMLVNMPGFGEQNLPGLVDALIRHDQKTEAKILSADDSSAKIKSAGRLLAGNKGLSCVKCHLFGGKGAPGIGAIDMQQMTNRLREDWFHRYLMAPTLYRPGTRMPASFPDGKSVVPDLYGGNPSSQIDAMWKFLLDRNKARSPIGVEQQMIELAAAERPVIYRNFLQGLSPRGIAVGYPEGGNIAWDAGAMSLTLLWKGSYIDASKHWVGRGPGNQDPLGDEVLTIEKSAPIASLEKLDAPWPEGSARERGYKFLGYRLDKQGRPTFRYRIDQVDVEETPVPARDNESTVSFRREFEFTGSASATGLVFRAASGKQIALGDDGWFSVDDSHQVRLSGAKIVEVGGAMELRIPIDLSAGNTRVSQEIRW